MTRPRPETRPGPARAARRSLAALLCAGATGCSEGPATPSDAGALDAFDAADGSQCSTASVVLTLGTGSGNSLSTYRPIADGDPVYLILGPQGGQHIWVSLRGRGFDPTLPRFEFRAYRPSDDALIGRIRIRLPMVTAPEDPSLFALASQTLTLDDQAYCSVLGGDVRIELAFDDLSGHCATVQRTVHLVGIDPDAPAATSAAWHRCCDERLPRCYPVLDASTASDASDASPD